MSFQNSGTIYPPGLLTNPALQLSDNEFGLFRDLIYDECGVRIGSEKRAFLESRLRRRMGALGVTTALEYYGLVRYSKTRMQEMPALLDIMMICETSFFRNQPQFDLLSDVVLPEIIANKVRANSRLIRIWSAGCSTGQEPYSAAMAVLERVPEPETWNVRVFASDLSFTALERAQSGVYSPDQIRGLCEPYMSKYFRRENGNYAVKDDVKRRIVFDYHNLKHDNGLRSLDVIFCRNVMIYFDVEEQRRLITRFTNCLVPGGYLFIGHAESLQGLSQKFAMLHRDKGIAYRFNG
ncbi:MAG TPA: protein-glutamate O-methyltransferase [Blastocatellia bacterium]|nr:protein-glutamate O-methyltransferase [Blastocatellia bacterium]